MELAFTDLRQDNKGTFSTERIHRRGEVERTGIGTGMEADMNGNKQNKYGNNF